ncbi:unnamed protein product, partial [Staurois parvus]
LTLREPGHFLPAAAYGYGPYNCGYGIQLQPFHPHSALIAFQSQHRQPASAPTMAAPPALLTADLPRTCTFYPQHLNPALQGPLHTAKSSARSTFSIDSIIGGELSPGQCTSSKAPGAPPVLSRALVTFSGSPAALGGALQPGTVLTNGEPYATRISNS